MNLVKFHSRGLDPWFNFDRFFDAPRPGQPRQERSFSPAVDVFEDDKRIVLKADLPEVDEKDLSLHVEDGTLTLTGERKWAKEEKNGQYHRVERSYGSFSRSFGIPDYVDAEKIAARYDKGVLEVTLPKVPEKASSARTIKINS